MNKKRYAAKFIWTIAYAHMIAHFIAGVIAFYVFDYTELYSATALSLLMRPTTDPMVALGPALQIFRGVILGFAIYPIRKVFIEDKYGYVKLGLSVLALSLLSTIGPTIGSFDGYIYTKAPVSIHMVGYPEAFLYIFLFTGIIYVSVKFADKMIMKVLPMISVALIILMGIAGYLSA